MVQFTMITWEELPLDIHSNPLKQEVIDLTQKTNAGFSLLATNLQFFLTETEMTVGGRFSGCSQLDN